MYQIGVFFQKLSRFFFSRVSGTCWNCGAMCGMGTIARGFMWCNECYARYQSYLRDPDYVFNVRFFGRVKRANNASTRQGRAVADDEISE